MSKSISKNLIYNILLQIVTVATPLITTPYISRILTKTGIGIYGYTNSIVQYFVIIGTLGISLYGNRTIAYVRDNKEKMSKTFWEITLLKLITTSLAFIIYVLIFGVRGEYKYIYIFQSINIIGAMFDISWLYMGLEDFPKTVTRNLIVKILCVISIFLFIKSYDDLCKYVFLNAFMNLGGNLVMWMYLPKILTKTKISLKGIGEHIIPTIQLFIPQVAVQIYAVLDRTMLGTLSSMDQVGVYDQSQKIIKLVLSLVTALGVVMLPRMSNTFAKGNKEKMNEYLNKSLNGVSYVVIPMAFGIAGISKELIPWFFGSGYEEVSVLMIILTPILFLIGMSNVLGTQYLLPSNRTKEFTQSVTAGAVINVIFNFILIPKLQGVGACISTVLAEFSVTAVQYVYLKNNIKKRYILQSIIKYVFASIVMYGVVRIIGMVMSPKITCTLMQSVVGIITYILFLLMLKERTNLIFIELIKEKVINRIRK